MKDCIVNILGTKYSVICKSVSEDSGLQDADAYTDFSSKEIVLRKENVGKLGDYENNQKSSLRHELLHAFLHESGLSHNSSSSFGSWTVNEEMVDWFAIQSPKIYKVFAELDILE